MPARPDSDAPSLGSRLVWFVGLWAGGVAAVALVGLAIKLMLGQ